MKREVKKIVTKEDLVKCFKILGIQSGMCILAHVAMSKFGYIAGGAHTFNEALLEAIGYNGTLVMPLQMSDNSEPAYFEKPAIKINEYELYRNSYPDFDERLSETRGMSKVSDNLRRYERSYVSSHPNCAFVAYGKYAKIITQDQDLDFGLGENSPLAKLYDLRSYTLLCGVGYDNMTALHLSEHRSQSRPVILNGARYKGAWRKYLDFDLDSNDGAFEAIGKRLEDKGLVKSYTFNNGTFKLIRNDIAIDEGVNYFKSL